MGYYPLKSNDGFNHVSSCLIVPINLVKLWGGGVFNLCLFFSSTVDPQLLLPVLILHISRCSACELFIWLLSSLQAPLKPVKELHKVTRAILCPDHYHPCFLSIHKTCSIISKKILDSKCSLHFPMLVFFIYLWELFCFLFTSQKISTIMDFCTICMKLLDCGHLPSKWFNL